uniref:Dehydrogenase/reductase (SDR family) member 13b.2 n=1 Tax=Paramormyrops kingsleyae TaxID=1676925 RepID=A0A3B3QAD0_9TELE|nr:tapasin-related protein-like isoform X1 [Paramormyrops kingsleyae]
MTVLKYILFIGLFSTGVLGSVEGIRWLPCQLVEEFFHRNSEGHLETSFHHRDVFLQFGKTGDLPEFPEAVTFLVTVHAGSKMDMRHYADGDPGDLRCEIRRYSTAGIQVLWKGPEAQEDDVWFTCALQHSQGLFSITTFLRHRPATPPNPQDDINKWSPIGERETLSTTAVMLVLTRSPAVTSALMRDPTLHCQFAVDHKQPDLTVEWRLQKHSERKKLYSFSSRSGTSEGRGVSVRGLSNGNASLLLPPTTTASEGIYICSIYVPPLYGSQDISLQILESPRVSLNVGPTLQLSEGESQKVVCDAEGYYPLDVQMEWLRQHQSQRLPEILKTVLFSSHRHHPGGTYSLSAFFFLQPTARDSGYTYTCRTSHASLRTPIRKSFTLLVTESASWTDIICGVGMFAFVGIMIYILLVMLRYLHRAKKESKVSDTVGIICYFKL